MKPSMVGKIAKRCLGHFLANSTCLAGPYDQTNGSHHRNSQVQADVSSFVFIAQNEDVVSVPLPDCMAQCSQFTRVQIPR